MHWTGVRPTISYAPVCPQAFPDIANVTKALQQMPKSRLNYLKKIRGNLAEESEDCLYLNIYVPSKIFLVKLSPYIISAVITNT